MRIDAFNHFFPKNLRRSSLGSRALPDIGEPVV